MEGSEKKNAFDISSFVRCGQQHFPINVQMLIKLVYVV